MDDSEHDARLAMRADFRRMVTALRQVNRLAGKPSTIAYIWRYCYRLGLTIDEETFLQWHAESEHRLIPLVSTGAVGDALAKLGIADQVNKRDRYLIDPMEWRRWCAGVVNSSLPPLNVVWEDKSHGATRIDFAESDPDDVQTYLDMEEKSVRARRLARKEKLSEERVYTDNEILAGAAAASARVRGRARESRSVPLPTNPDDAFHWAPFASAPSTVYWLWRWGVTKDKLRAVIRTHAQWAVDTKDGFLLTDMRAVRWAWAHPLPANPRGTFGQAMSALGADIRRPVIERKMREQLVELMASALDDVMGTRFVLDLYDGEFAQFDAAMALVREKTRRLVVQGENAPRVPIKQLHRWFETSMEKNDD